MKITRGKPLTEVDENIIVKDIAEGIIQEAVARKLDRQVRTVQ